MLSRKWGVGRQSPFKMNRGSNWVVLHHSLTHSLTHSFTRSFAQHNGMVLNTLQAQATFEDRDFAAVGCGIQGRLSWRGWDESRVLKGRSNL